MAADIPFKSSTNKNLIIIYDHSWYTFRLNFLYFWDDCPYATPNTRAIDYIRRSKSKS